MKKLNIYLGTKPHVTSLKSLWWSQGPRLKDILWTKLKMEKILTYFSYNQDKTTAIIYLMNNDFVLLVGFFT